MRLGESSARIMCPLSLYWRRRASVCASFFLALGCQVLLLECGNGKSDCVVRRERGTGDCRFTNVRTLATGTKNTWRPPKFPVLCSHGLCVADGGSLAWGWRDTLGFLWRDLGRFPARATIGFIAVMVFSVGHRILPAFAGMRLLWSTR